MASISEETIREDLKTLAGKLGIEVRIERFYGTGGLCVVGGVKKLIINKDLSVEKHNEILVDELSKFDLSNVYLSPLLRRIMGADDAGDDMTPYSGLPGGGEEAPAAPAGGAQAAGAVPGPPAEA